MSEGRTCRLQFLRLASAINGKMEATTRKPHTSMTQCDNVVRLPKQSVTLAGEGRNDKKKWMRYDDTKREHKDEPSKVFFWVLAAGFFSFRGMPSPPLLRAQTINLARDRSGHWQESNVFLKGYVIHGKH